jgi:hypothetical protein
MITVTQYLRPNGRRQLIEVDRPPEIEEKAAKLMELGLTIDAEVLTTGHVSVSVGDPKLDEYVWVEVSPNNEKVLEAFDRVINGAYLLRVENASTLQVEASST